MEIKPLSPIGDIQVAAQLAELVRQLTEAQLATDRAMTPHQEQERYRQQPPPATDPESRHVIQRQKIAIDQLAISEREIARLRNVIVGFEEHIQFREACDAAHVEGQLARSIGLPLEANPYTSDEPADRIMPGRPMRDFLLPWMMGWRDADEMAALDALVAAAKAATRAGRATPACPSGEQLREAVAAYLERSATRANPAAKR